MERGAAPRVLSGLVFGAGLASCIAAASRAHPDSGVALRALLLLQAGAHAEQLLWCIALEKAGGCSSLAPILLGRFVSEALSELSLAGLLEFVELPFRSVGAFLERRALELAVVVFSDWIRNALEVAFELGVAPRRLLLVAAHGFVVLRSLVLFASLGLRTDEGATLILGSYLLRAALTTSLVAPRAVRLAASHLLYAAAVGGYGVALSSYAFAYTR